MIMKSVMRGDDCVGFILGGPRGYRAYGEAGEPLGFFQNEQDAAKTVYAADDRACAKD
jgi:hypothetical protein